jgi:putative AlgH/UPF0301 family transcriptional regulator
MMICSICNQAEMVPIWYGVPEQTEIMMAQFDQIVLGGPVEKEYTHFCHQCQVTYPTEE